MLWNYTKSIIHLRLGEYCRIIIIIIVIIIAIIIIIIIIIIIVIVIIKRHLCEGSIA